MTNPSLRDLDQETVLDEPDRVTLESGSVILLNRLRTRETLKLLRIVTHGGRESIMDLRIDPNDDQGTFVMKFLGMLLFAIPDAESETIEFIFSLAKPLGLIEHPNLNKQEKEKNLALWTKLADELENPSLDDMITILETVITREAPDLMALGKRLKSMWDLIQRVGKGKTANPPDPISLESLATNTTDQSPPSATSSPQSTDGPPSTSSIDTPSVDFGKSAEQLYADAS